MDVDERIVTILQECRWVQDPATAVRLIPAIAAEAPPFVMLPQRDADVRASIPVVCLPMLAAGVTRTIVDAVNGKGSGFEDLSPAEVAQDPLAAALADAFSQCARPGLRSLTVPVLATAYAAWQVLGGSAAQLPGVDESLAGDARTAAARMAAASGTAAAELSQAVGWALKARVTGGLSLAGMSGSEILTGGLYRQILMSPLLMAFPRGTLDTDPGKAASVLGLSLEPALVQAALKAAAVLVTESQQRLESGKAEPFDIALQAVVPANIDPEVAALHPTAGPALIAALPTLGDARSLQKAGIEKRFAKGLTAVRGARALAAAWRTLCDALGTWDVLSSLVHRVVPLREHEGRMVGPSGALPADARWPLLLPRPNAAATIQAVVAVRLTEVRESLLGSLVTRPWSLANVPRAFDQVARANGASVRQIIGDHAVCTFPAPELALRFSLLVRKAIGPDSGLVLGDDDTTIAIPPTSALGIGLALGVVEGGTDGERSDLSGRGVAEAMALAGNGRAARLHDDGVGVRTAGWGAGGLQNEGIVASEAFVRTVLDRTRRRNRPVHVRGEGGMCGGVGDDFALAPVSGWWEAGDDLIAAALLIDAETGEGAAEVRVLTTGDFREWHASDKSSAALRRAPSSRSLPGTMGGAFDAPAPSGSDHFGDGLDEPSMSFMGGGGRELRAREKADEPPEVTTDPTTADGFLAMADETDEEAHSGFGFVMEDDLSEPSADKLGFAASSEPTPSEPAPPMMLMDDEDDAPEPAPRVSAPMLMPDEPTASSDTGYGFSMAGSSEVPRGPAPPMMLMDDEDSHSVPSAPMMLHDDEDDEPAAGLLGEVTASDPFADEPDGGAVGLEPADSAFGPASDNPASGMSMLHSTYQGEMELVGVAGFSLAGDETALGDNPFHDPSENTGFYDERMSANPRRMDTAGTVPEPRKKQADGAMVRELVRLLRGYVVVHDGRSHTFGLPDGGLLRDAHTHEGSVSDAYVSFLQSKVAEGFIPRADRVVALVPGARPAPISSEAIEQAAGPAGL